MPICFRARPRAAQRSVDRSSLGPRSARAAALQPVPQSGLPAAGRRATHAPAPAPAHGRPGPIRCRRACRRAHPARPSAAQSARAAGASNRRFSIRRSRPLLHRQSGPRRRRARIPGLHRCPARARRAPAAHRSRRTCHPACRSASALQGAALSSGAGPRPQAAGDATYPGLRRQRKRGAVRPVHKPPARCPCTFSLALAPAVPALAEACTSAESARPGCAQVSRHCHVAERFASASPTQGVTSCAPRHANSVSAPQGRQGRLPVGAAPQGSDTGRGLIVVAACTRPAASGMRARPAAACSGSRRVAGSTQWRTRADRICKESSAPRLRASTLRTWPPRRASLACRPFAAKWNRYVVRPRPAGRAGASLRRGAAATARPGSAAPHSHAGGGGSGGGSATRGFCERRLRGASQSSGEGASAARRRISRESARRPHLWMPSNWPAAGPSRQSSCRLSA